MKLLVLAIVLCVAQCQARDHKRQYLPPLPEEDLSPPPDDTKSRNNDASLISQRSKLRNDDDLEQRYTWEDLKSDVKYFTLNKLSQFKFVFDGYGWINVSRLLAAWIEWLNEPDEEERSAMVYHRN